MSVLKKIRENVGLVIVIIALSLFAFIFSSVYNKLGPSQDNTIGEVNGNSIDYGALNAKFEMAQRNNPNATGTAEQYQLKEQAWQSLVRESYYNREWLSAGIGISDDELMMMFSGQIYHPYVVQSGYFNDSTGRYNPSMVPLVFQRADEIDMNDPSVQDMWKNWKQGLLDLREIISLDRRSNKWQAAIKGSALVSDNEVKWGYEQSSRTADVSYLYVPYASIPDDQVQITDGDRSEYYNKHRESFKRSDDEVRIKYAYFTVAPSRQDSAETREDLMKLQPEFLSTATPFAFAGTSSDDRAIDTIPKPLGQLPAALAALQGRTDTVIGPMLGANGFQLMRIVKVTQDSANANVQVRRIMINLKGGTAADSLVAKTTADSVATLLRADKSQFAALAAAMGDMNPAAAEGIWVPENAFGDKFAKDIKAASVGNIVVTSTQDAPGYAVIDLMDRSSKMYSFATITRQVVAGTETNDSIFKRASMFHGEVISGGDMDKVITGYPEGRSLVTGNIGPGTYTLMGLTAGRPVVTWAFKSEQGKVCDKLIEADDAFVIARVEYKGEKGYTSVEGLKDNMEFDMAVRNWMKAKQIKAKLGNGGADLQSMASTYGVGATTGAAKGLRMASSDVQGVGPEPKVVGRAFGMQPSSISKPLAGNAGVFVVKLEAIQEPAPIDELNKMIQTQTLRGGKSEQTVNALFMGMRELAEIRDLRYKADF
jgi:peptidyl-prolyl cis-trans isomerase D